MTLVPVWLFSGLIYLGLAIASAGFLLLIGLLIRDARQKNIW